MNGHLDIPDVVLHVLIRNCSKSSKDRWNVINKADAQIKAALNERMWTFPCPNCGSIMELVSNTEHYGHEYTKAGYRWVCTGSKPCDTNIGCHGTTCVPLGIPAGPELRIVRQKCHDLFDVLWKTADFERGKAYRWLSRRMEIPLWQCHVAMFNEDTCNKAIGILEAYLRKLNRTENVDQ